MTMIAIKPSASFELFQPPVVLNDRKEEANFNDRKEEAKAKYCTTKITKSCHLKGIYDLEHLLVL